MLILIKLLPHLRRLHFLISARECRISPANEGDTWRRRRRMYSDVITHVSRPCLDRRLGAYLHERDEWGEG